MKSILQIVTKFKLAVLALVSMSVSSIITLAQTPTHYPTGTDPVDFTPVNIIVFIVVPVLMVLVYFWYRRYIHKKNSEKKENNSSGN